LYAFGNAMDEVDKFLTDAGLEVEERAAQRHHHPG
jgi:hypothetical protein